MGKDKKIIGKPFEKGNTINKELDYDNIVKLFSHYIETTEMPIIAEFSYQNNVRRETLYSIKDDRVKTLLKRPIEKKETYLEKEALKGNINQAMAIFSLKQCTWREKVETKNENSNTNLNIQVEDEETKKGIEDMENM